MFRNTHCHETVLQLVPQRVSKHHNYRKSEPVHRRQCVAAVRQLPANTRSPLRVFRARRAGASKRSTRCSNNTASVDNAANETPLRSVSTFKNWWQLGAHPKFAAETLSFYSALKPATPLTNGAINDGVKTSRSSSLTSGPK